MRFGDLFLAGVAESEYLTHFAAARTALAKNYAGSPSQPPGEPRVQECRMIYRILSDSKIAIRDETTNMWLTITGSPLKGGYMAGLAGFALVAPDIQNDKARFYFTEKGWREIGKPIVAEARREGHRIRVYKRKNPTRSQIVYKDELQVAILPRKNIPRKRRK